MLYSAHRFIYRRLLDAIQTHLARIVVILYVLRHDDGTLRDFQHAILIYRLCDLNAISFGHA